MDIILNDEKLDFSLEQEKYLKDIVHSLDEWSRKSGHFISEILVDGKTIPVEEASASDLSVDSIKTLHCYIKGKLELIEEVFPVLKNYVFRFRDAIDLGMEAFCMQKREKIEGLLWVIDSVKMITQNLGIKPVHIFLANRNLEELLNFFRVSVQSLTENIHDSGFFYNFFLEGVAERLDALLKMLDQMVSFYNYLAGSGDKDFVQVFLDESTEIQSLLEEIPGFLQDGKDQDALAMIQKAMYFFEAFNLVLSKSSMAANEELLSLEEDIIEMMNNLYDCYKSQDIVSVSDIVEYEMVEKLEELSEVLKNAHEMA